MGSYCLMGTGFQFCKITRLLEMDGGDVNALFLKFSPPPFHLICSHVRTLIKWTLHTHFCGTV